jgi:hypothetical protein
MVGSTGLLAKDIANKDDLRIPMTASEFLAKAWKLANKGAGARLDRVNVSPPLKRRAAEPRCECRTCKKLEPNRLADRSSHSFPVAISPPIWTRDVLV